MKFINSLTFKTKLVISFLICGAIPALIVGTMSWLESKEVIDHLVFNELHIMREGKTRAIEGSFQQFEKQIKVLSNNKATVDALKAFKNGFDKYFEELNENVSKEEMLNSVNQYYSSTFNEQYKKLNNGQSANEVLLIPKKLNENKVALQYSYISNNSHPLGEKDKLQGIDDGTSWSRSHREFHENFKKYISYFGFYDLFLIDNDTGNIVYSVAKELDFATSLKIGPYSNSALGVAFKEALKANNNDFTFITDLSKYKPSYEDPSSFIASPIYDGETKIGVLVFQIPVKNIDEIMTSSGKWKEHGYGLTGESYIVGSDKKMRSISRKMLEDKKSLIKKLSQENYKNESLNYMKAKNTTVLEKRVDTASVEKAFKTVSSSGDAIYINDQGEKVLSSFKRLEINGLDWYIFSEMNESEALSELKGMAFYMLLLILGSLVLIGGVAWIFASKISDRIFMMVQRLEKVSGITDRKSIEVKEASQKVSAATTEQASAIQETVSTLNEITAMANKSVEYVKDSMSKSNTSYSVAEEGKQSVEEMIQAMNTINQSNEVIREEISKSNGQIANIVKVINEISEKTNVINDIVFQTKLLSFNASVEAARAGEHGRGFSVVAEEIGNLAEMSGKAAKEISIMLRDSIVKVEAVVAETGESVDSLIMDGKRKIESGVTIAQECGAVLEEVVNNVGEVKELMNEIATSSEEQADGINNISSVMNQMEETTHQNSQVALDTSKSSQELLNQVASLNDVVLGLQVEIAGDYQIKNKPKNKVVNLIDYKKSKMSVFQKEEVIADLQRVAGDDYPRSDDPRFK